MNENCDIIRDLLPLYRDNVCSEASRALVEAHLKECAECRRALQAIEAEVSAPEPTMQETFKAWQKLQRKILLKRLMKIAAVAVALVIASGAGFVVYDQYMFAHHQIDINTVTVRNLCRLADGRIYFELDAEGHEISGAHTNMKDDRPEGATEWSGPSYFSLNYSRNTDKSKYLREQPFDLLIEEVQQFPTYENGERVDLTYMATSIVLMNEDTGETRHICDFDDELPPASEEIEEEIREREGIRNG